MRTGWFSSLALASILLAGCVPRWSSTQTIPSPDGSLTLVTSIEQSHADPKTYLCVVFEIRDRSGHVLHRENTRASDVMRWKMVWESNESIRLDSSDIGPSRWVRQPGGIWKRQPEL